MTYDLPTHLPTDDIRTLMSTNRCELDDAPGPRGWNRRRFLQAIGAGLLGGASIGTLVENLLGGDLPDAWAGPPIGPTDRILVNVMFFGGMDSLNVVVPYADAAYRSQRGSLAIAAASVLPINAALGLAPQLPYVKSLYDQRQVAIVQGLGYNPPDLSHFSSMATVMAGKLGTGPTTNGWLGRWLDGQPASANLAVVTTDTSVPLHLTGVARKAAGVSVDGGMFGTTTTDSDLRMYTAMRNMSATTAGRGALHDTFASTVKAQLDVAAEVTPVFTTAIPEGGELVRKMTAAARLINANIGVRVVDVGRSGFDTHDNEPYQLTTLLTEFDAALAAFYATLSPALASKVTIMTMSEFGRTLQANGSSGTDHGTASSHFVIGQRVKGGLYGAMPSLTASDANGRLISTVDFRSLYGTVLDGWMGGGGSDILGGTSFEHLDIFLPDTTPPTTTTAPTTTAPAATTTTLLATTTTVRLTTTSAPPTTLPPTTSTTAPTTTVPATTTTVPSTPTGSGFVPLVPVRILDTRTGTGGRSTPLAAGAPWSLTIAGRNGVPANATAAVFHLTAVSATASTFLTAWPAGQTRPRTTNLDPVPGRSVTDLVVTGLGTSGAVSFFVNSGTTHLVADLVGYMVTTGGASLLPVAPARLLDTRNGTGGFSAALTAKQEIQLQVAGRGGVPSGATAVIVNVTAIQPTATTGLTVWASGSSRPAGASVTTVAGRTISNLAIAKVGAGGKLSIFNDTGSTHVTLDVVGCYDGTGSGRYVPMKAVRLLDTRTTTGGTKGKVGMTPLKLQVAGVSGVPAGVSTVLVNVIAVRPSATTSITVYPSGSAKPALSNVSANANDRMPNMVLARLGADGAIMLSNATGTTDLVVDIAGWFNG